MKKILVALAAIFLLLGCQNNNNSEPKNNGSFFSTQKKSSGIINEGILLMPIGLVPYFNHPSENIIKLIYSKLISTDESNNLKGDLARSWKVLSPNTLEFELCDNIHWHDGKSLKLSDFEKSFEIAKNVGILNYKNISITLKDNYLKIESDNILNPEIISKIYILPYHKLSKSNLQNSSLLYEPVGTGAFKFVNSDDKSVKLQKFNNYFKGKIYVNEYNFIFYDNLKRIFENFDNGTINFFKITTYTEDEKKYILDNNKTVLPSNTFQVLAINPNSKNLNSNNLRNYFLNLLTNKYNDLIDGNFYQKIEFENLMMIKDNILMPKRILLIVENEKNILKLAQRVKKIWNELNVDVVLQKKSFIEIVYYINKGFKSDGIIFNWKELNINNLNAFYGLNFEGIKLTQALKMLRNSGFIFPFSRKLNFVFHKNIKGIKIKYNINHPENWFF
jgi:MarR-like DNA-binding transcriptional regulator SgrR of sgrS sRNA